MLMWQTVACLVRQALIFGEICIRLSAAEQLNSTSPIKVYLSTATGVKAERRRAAILNTVRKSWLEHVSDKKVAGVTLTFLAELWLVLSH